jgi:serine protease Do
MVAAAKPGSKVGIDLWRKGAAKQVTVVIAEMPDDGKLARADKKPSDDGGEMITRLGIAVSELNKAQRQELQINGGLVIEDVKGSVARAAGLQTGDVLLAIGNIQLRSLKQLNEILKQVAKGGIVALLVRRGDAASYVAIRLDEK